MIVLCFIFLILLTIFPRNIAVSVADTLELCQKSVIPSLFPFLIASNMIILSKKVYTPLNYLLSKIFGISLSSTWAFILGIICGYPIGGKIALELYDNNIIDKEEKDRLLILANNSGPGFIIGMLGGAIFKNIKVGFIIYISHILASIIYGILTSFFYTKSKNNFLDCKSNDSFFKILSISINKSMEAVIGITGVICFFSSIIALLDLIPFISGFKLKGLLYGLLEMTNGIKIISTSLISLRLKASLCSFLLSFSGLSIFMQLKSFSDNINKASYLFGKMLCAVISFIITFFLI